MRTCVSVLMGMGLTQGTARTRLMVHDTALAFSRSDRIPVPMAPTGSIINIYLIITQYSETEINNIL